MPEPKAGGLGIYTFQCTQGCVVLRDLDVAGLVTLSRFEIDFFAFDTAHNYVGPLSDSRKIRLSRVSLLR